MEVEIISQENIKPSSPTPQHFRVFKLSLLDQFITPSYVPLLLFYDVSKNGCRCTDHLLHHQQSTLERLQLLKKSLSETLTLFYPLAGKMKDDCSIDCDDEGANFLEARVNHTLHQFLSKPDLLLLHKFLPCQPFLLTGSIAGTYVTNIQVNVFECGGIAIGMCVSHKIVDGAALSNFLEVWSANARDNTCNKNIDIDDLLSVSFVSTSLFPAKDLWLGDFGSEIWGSWLKEGKFVTRRFVFDAPAIASLKDRARSSTRVEAVSALIWKCTTAASQQKHGMPRRSFLTHAVNLRTRMTHPASKNSLGNQVWVASGRLRADEERELDQLAREIRVGISKINGDFIKELGGEKGKEMMLDFIKEIKEFGSNDETDYLGFTSWCKFGFYGADFGWGKPVWVSNIGVEAPLFANFVVLIESRLGDGIEAWVTIDEEEMMILQSDNHLLSYASLDPSPLTSL
ncbi:BAHD acyltransferase At5g47980-like [Carica papaya]|uniref:BAHD acyltransferase At5g47980-like n=1 Tax=Carica papaya TaxID=3649 RepID=UPI000B8CAF08|nr:BAHD acyltransferase At5g47980-like [Carica papaya]